MVIRVSDKKKNYSKVTKLLVKPKHFKDRILYEMYHQLLKDAHIPIRYDGKRQRIHDLRHLFAIKSLKQMEDKGFDLYTSLPILSVYLGHKHITCLLYTSRAHET